MATIFELYIVEPDFTYARQAAQAAFAELDRLEQELSRFIETSDISRINHHRSRDPLRIGLDAFECLLQCSQLYQETDGAFDITSGGIMDRQLRQETANSKSSGENFQELRQPFGMHQLELDEQNLTVRLKRFPIHLDLGGFGKGYALDRMGALLAEWDISIALLHGGWSTVLALDAPPDSEGWKVSISHPQHQEILKIFVLKNQALSGSGVQKGQHIINPRTPACAGENRCGHGCRGCAMAYPPPLW